MKSKTNSEYINGLIRIKNIQALASAQKVLVNWKLPQAKIKECKEAAGRLEDFIPEIALMKEQASMTSLQQKQNLLKPGQQR